MPRRSWTSKEYYPLIAAYFQRPAMNEKFAARVTKLADAPQSSFYMHTRTHRVSCLFVYLLICIYTYITICIYRYI